MSYEVMYKRIRFESFIALSEIRKDFIGATIRYNGNDICGELQIDFGIGVKNEEKERFLKLANETIKLF